MSYQVIARKWRPQTFDQVTGQEHVTRALRNAVLGSRIPHALVLAGPRGVGKTTLARILARSLNCDEGPTDTPCGTCASCADIIAGNSSDVQEIDAASRTGVNDIRAVIEAIRYAPSPGKHRIFVIDEVHQLSSAAFNALLKTLEEPPPSSLFVLATTNPEKMPATILSRCQRYDLRLFTTQEVAGRLEEICREEGIEISASSLRDLAREGQGSMRDSQTLLDQALAYGGDKVEDSTIAKMLDLVDRHVLEEILAACIDSDAAKALTVAHKALKAGADPKRMSDSLAAYLRDLVVLSVAPNAEGLVEGGEAELKSLGELARRGGTARLRRMFKALMGEQEDLAWAPQPGAVLEMALVRLATLPSGQDVAELLERLHRLEKTPSPPGGSGPGPATPTGGSAPGGRGKKKSPSQTTAPKGAPAPSGQPAPKKEAGASPSPQHQAAEPTREPGALAAVMDRLRVFAAKDNQPLAASLEQARLTKHAEDSLQIAPASSFQAKRLADRIDELEDLATRFFQKTTRVEIDHFAETPTGGAKTSKSGARPRQQQEREKIQTALNDPVLNDAIKVLGGEIVKIVPLSGEQST
ncbi:MAG: DNA polymerase III subunit gamma/tau [Myxococcota bacterium]|nr:DNA polymerase III subunit gamma/tau [Myxococcota bacterium]